MSDKKSHILVHLLHRPDNAGHLGVLQLLPEIVLLQVGLNRHPSGAKLFSLPSEFD
jgi:hypothetical protein